jgi:DNA-binding transcriptional MerR regulator
MHSFEHLTTLAAADLLGKDVRTIHRWVAAGLLNPVMKFPGQTGGYLFSRAEVERVKASVLKAAS